MLEPVKCERGDVLPVRATIALAVPALAAAAHGRAGDVSASASDLVLLLGVGALAALVAVPSQHAASAAVRRPKLSMLRTAGVLSAAQICAHLVLAAGTHVSPGHGLGMSWSMVTAHAVATGLTAVVVAVAAQLAHQVGVVLVAARRLVAGHEHSSRRVPAPVFGVVRVPSSAALSGAGGVRGPPGTVAVPHL